MNNILLPTVVDIETSGIGLMNVGIWQIGAIDLNTMEEFLDECRIDDDDLIVNMPEADKTFEEVTGKTEEEIRDENKQSQEELIRKFFKWAEKRKVKNFLCQNPQFDLGWIWAKAQKYNLVKPFGYRAFDLHTITQTRFFDLNKKFSIDEGIGKSNLSLTPIMQLCGMNYGRGYHNALEDCKLEAECFSRLMFGKNLFPEFAKFKVPTELRR